MAVGERMKDDTRNRVTVYYLVIVGLVASLLLASSSAFGVPG